MEFLHKPVLLEEVLVGLAIKENGIYVDGTCGGAGHSGEIAKRLKGGRLIGLDRDPDAVKVATKRLETLPATVVQTKYSEIKSVLLDLGINGIDGALFDLGVSSFQLDCAERGFSYHNDAPLDMRMSKTGTTAADLVNTLSLEELTGIFRDYGEEQFAYKIAKNIVRMRVEEPIDTTLRLSEIISASVPASKRRDKHPAKKCFQALRIAVNGEFDEIKQGITDAFEMLNSGGRLCVITFHSLEDRIVKQIFASFCKGCTCPPDLPVCVCNNKPKGKLICKKPIIASELELQDNSRSRSAKLRIIEKL